MDVLGELIVRPTLAEDEIESERAVIVEEIRSYLDDPSEYCQILFQTAMFGDGPLGREICGDEDEIRALPAGTIRDFWRTIYRPANTVVALAGDLGHAEAVDAHRGRVRDRQRRRARVRAGARPARRPAGRGRQARHRAGAALHRRPGAPSRPPRQLDARGPQRGPRRRDEQPALPVGPRGARARLRRLVRARRLRGRRRARDLGRGRPVRAAARPSTRSWSSSPGCATSWSPTTSWPRPSATSSGGLELRMDDTRHVASWIGGQEALHDRVLTLEEALAAVDAVDAAAVQRLAATLVPRRRPAARGRRPGPLPARPRRAPAVAGDDRDGRRERPWPARPSTRRRATRTSSWRGLHLRLGSLALARVELETLAGVGALDDAGPVDLAEVRWRTGDLARRRRGRRRASSPAGDEP